MYKNALVQRFIIQPELESEGLESFEGPELHPIATETSKAPELQIVEPKQDEHFETSKSSAQSKIIELKRYVKRHHAPK